MRVSLVIPAHNEEHYIAETLRAALAEEYPDFEIIVVNNNSTDNTANIVKSFPAVKLLTETRKGTQFARECGRKAATGEIIACIDADCLPDPKWLARGVSYFSDPRVVAVSGPCDYHDAGRPFRIVSLLFQKFVFRIVHAVFQTLRIGAVMQAGNCLIKASALERIGGFDTSFLFYGDDTDTAKRLRRLGKLVYSNSFYIKTSARRFSKLGIARTFYHYTANFFWVTFFRNPYDKILLHGKKLLAKTSR